MAEIDAGASLVVLATDPEAPIDLAAWAAREGHDYSERRRDAWIEFTLRKRA